MSTTDASSTDFGCLHLWCTQLIYGPRLYYVLIKKYKTKFFFQMNYSF